MEDAPTLSVILPIYNQERYLAKCLDSIINQKYYNLEIVCVNDGSTDSTAKILDEYSKKDDRIRIVSKPNGGVASARNAGLDASRGRYITFVDPDDYVHPDIYVKTVQYMEDYDLVQFNAYNDNPDGMISWDLPGEGPTELTYEVNAELRPSVWNKIFRADIIREHGLRFPDGLNNEDCMFSHAYRSLLKEGYFVNDRLYYYVAHENSITSDFYKKTSKHNLDHILILVPLADFLRKNGTYESYSLQLLNLYTSYCWFVIKTTHGKLRLSAIKETVRTAKRVAIIDVVRNSARQVGMQKLLSMAFGRIRNLF